MTKKQSGKHRGRFQFADYIFYIQKLFNERYPDEPIAAFTVDYVLRLFWDYIKTEMIKGNTTHVVGVGKFSNINRPNKYGDSQHYPRLRLSKHFVYGIREELGTLTEAEKRALEEKRAFISDVWEKRKEYHRREEEIKGDRKEISNYSSGGLDETLSQLEYIDSLIAKTTNTER